MSRASDFEGLEKECTTAYAERVKDIKRIARETTAFIGDSKKARRDMAAELHKKIDTEEAARKRQAKADRDARVAADKKLKDDTRKMVKQMDADNKKLKDDTRKMVAGFEAETDAARKAWGSLVRTMAEKRKGKVKEPAAPPAVKKPLAATEPAKKEAPPVPVGDAAKLMSLVRANPGGIKLTDIESKTGIARIQAARILKELVDDGKITKEELLYKPL